MEALNRFDFDSIFLPVTIASMTDIHPDNDFRPILQIAQEREIAVLAIKSIMKRRWQGDQTHSTWYQPLDDEDGIKNAIWYTLSQDGVTTLPLSCDVKLWPDILKAAESYKKLSLEEQDDLIESAKKEQYRPLFPESV